MQIDTSTDFGRRAERRLRQEMIIWLITVRRDGTTQPTPVGFVWDGRSVLIYSQPNQQKRRNIANNPNVSLHLDSDDDFGGIVVLTGTATTDENGGRPGLLRPTAQSMRQTSNGVV